MENDDIYLINRKNSCNDSKKEKIYKLEFKGQNTNKNKEFIN